MIIILFNLILLFTLLDKCSPLKQVLGVVLFNILLAFGVVYPLAERHLPEESRKTMFDSHTGKPYTRITLDTPWWLEPLSFYRTEKLPEEAK